LVTLTYSINNNYYGLAAEEVRRVLTKNKIPIFKITLDAYIKNIGKNTKIVINPSEVKLEK
jgi:guanylate kinase